MGWLEDLREYVEQYGTAPLLETMPQLTLKDKGINGPTSAHRIEELHTPLNFGYITLTTGTTAFQNIVGVTLSEIDDRVSASVQALLECGIGLGDEMLVTYPPLVNVFPQQALSDIGVRWSFLRASSQDALMLELCEWGVKQLRTQGDGRKAVVGESSFLRATLENAKRMGLLDKLPRNLVLITAGTPLDTELLPIADSMGAVVHDLYGCQEFGWLTLDGVPLRKDISLLPSGDGGMFDLIVGGLATGDKFPILDSGHICNTSGKIITYARQRTAPDMETTILQTTANSIETIERLARTILRIKSKIVRLAPDCTVGAGHTVLSVAAYQSQASSIITGPISTRMFDSLLDAQMQHQSKVKNDPTWNKER